MKKTIVLGMILAAGGLIVSPADAGTPVLSAAGIEANTVTVSIQ